MKRILDLVLRRPERQLQEQAAEILTDTERRRIQQRTAEIQESVEVLQAKVAGLKAEVGEPGA